MSYIIVLAVVILFYFLTKNYNANDYQHINVETKQTLKGDLREHEAGLLGFIDGKSCQSRWQSQ